MIQKRWTFKIYHYDPESKYLDMTETCTTKVMTEVDFKKLLKQEIEKPINHHSCFEVTTKGFRRR